MKAGIGIVVAVLLLVGGYAGYTLYSSSQAAKKWDSAKEILSEKIENDGQVWKIQMSSMIDKPIDRVWEAVTQPEKSSEYIPENFKLSELKKHEGNEKVVAMRVQVLTLPVQQLLSRFTFDEASHRVTVNAEGPTQKMDATYVLTASPDGTKTLLEYDAVSTMKISVPLPRATQEGAFKELFVKTVRAIKKGIEAEIEKKAA